MKPNQITNNTLVIDIETISEYPDYEALPDRLKPLWDKKASFIKHEEELTADELYFKKAGIYAEFGKVICIAVGFFNHTDDRMQLRVKAIYGDDEKSLLEEFKSLLSKFGRNPIKLVAHNGKEFDFPYLCRRMLVHGIELPEVLNISGKKPWEINHVDTMELWKFGDRKNYSSLELLAAIFDIETSKDDIDGSMVNEVYYKEIGLERIAEYCKSDVVVTAQLYLKLNLLPAIEKENIVLL